MEDIKNILEETVLEKGIVDLIFHYKKHVEWAEKIEKHNGDWFIISQDGDLTMEFIKHFEHKISIDGLLLKQKLNTEIIDYFGDRIIPVYWSLISMNKTITEEFIIEYADKLDWQFISLKENLSEDLIRRFSNEVLWDCVCIHSKMSCEFMEEHIDNIDFEIISKEQDLDEDFIRRYKDDLNWFLFSEKLDEDFIREFQDRVDWGVISKYKTDLSEEFKQEFFTELNTFESLR